MEEKEERGVSKTFSLVLKRASLICTICPPRISELKQGKMTAAENRTCIITLPLSECKSQASLSLFLKHHELTSQNVFYFLINESKNKTLTENLSDLLNHLEIAHDIILMRFVNEIRTKGYDDTCINVC